MRLNARSPSAAIGLVVLVDVVQRRLEDEVRLPVVPELDQELEDLLAVVRERPHVEVVHRQVLGRDAELGRRLAHLARERVGREALRQRARRDRERDVADLGALPRRAAPSSPPQPNSPSSVCGASTSTRSGVPITRAPRCAHGDRREREQRPRRAGPRRARCRRGCARRSRPRLVRRRDGRGP